MFVMPGYDIGWVPVFVGSASRTSGPQPAAVAGEREHLPHLAVVAALEVGDHLRARESRLIRL